MAKIGATVELYGTGSCPYTREMREDLLWQRVGFVEYDVDIDREARARLHALSGGQPTVPMLVEDGRVAEIGWRGRGCIVP